MIPGTSKILSKSGPGDLRIITKMLQKIQDKLWNHPGKILFLSIWDIKIFEIVRDLYVLGTSFFRFFWFFRFCFWMFLCFLNIYLGNIFTKMRNWKWYIFHYETAPQLGFEFHIYQKTWNTNLVNPPYLDRNLFFWKKHNSYPSFCGFY